MRTSPRWLRGKRRREETALVFYTHATLELGFGVHNTFLLAVCDLGAFFLPTFLFLACRDSS
jgi:hypothetical protein